MFGGLMKEGIFIYIVPELKTELKRLYMVIMF
jgi:hypothetical protein